MDIVTVQDYRDFTGDNTTDEDTVSARIERVVGVVQDEVHRFLPLDDYTESLPLGTNFVVWPQGVPVDSVTSPSGAAPVFGGYGIGGTSPEAWWDPTFGPFEVWVLDPYVSVTYRGGYSRATFPVGLRMIICDMVLAMATRNPAMTAAAVQSASVGDVSVTYTGGGTGSGAADGILPGVSDRLRRYRRPT